MRYFAFKWLKFCLKVKKATTIVGLTFSSGEPDHLAAGVGQQQSPSDVQTGSGGGDGAADF